MIEVKEPFAIRLKKTLSIREMTQADLARATAIREGTISQYCTGYTKPKDKRLVLIANILRVNPSWLMGLDVPMSVSESGLVKTESPEVKATDSILNLTNPKFSDLKTLVGRGKGSLTPEQRMELAKDLLSDEDLDSDD